MRLKLGEKQEEPIRSRLRRAAESLFATYGVTEVSVRSITKEAGANMAAVNYHFGGKERLVVEVFREVARRSAERRLTLLAERKQRAEVEQRSPTLSEIIDAFVDPYVDAGDRRTGTLLARLVMMHRVAPNTWTKEVVRTELDGLAEAFIAALSEAAPHLDAAQVHWRYHLMVGAILVALSDDGPNSRMQRLSGGLCKPSDRNELRRELVSFLTAAFSGGTAAQGAPARDP